MRQNEDGGHQQLARRPVAERTAELVRAVAALSDEIAVWARTEEHNRKLLHDLGERVKELTALHGVAQLLSYRARTVPALLQEIVSLLPPAWQYPETTTARIRFDGTEYTSANFAASQWKQAAEVTIADGRPLVMEVFYLTEQPAEWEGPFLAEERRLINSLVQMLKSALDRRQAEEALAESERRIRDLAGRLIVAQEEERRRIASELHDDILQQLAMLGMASSKLKAQFGASTSAAESFGELEDQTLQLSKAIRRVSHELHPALLNHADLITVLRVHCNEFESATHIRTVFNAEGSANHLSPELSLNLYRIVQEALRNVAKHSGAEEAAVSLLIDETECRLSITDRGRGFDVKDGLRSGGLGLSSIEERARLLQGTLKIASDIGKETTIVVRAPLTFSSGEARKTQVVG